MKAKKESPASAVQKTKGKGKNFFLETLLAFAITFACATKSFGAPQIEVLDTHGHVIIPRGYARIESVDKDKFLTHSLSYDEGLKNPAADEKKLFDKNGRPLNLLDLAPPFEQNFKGIPSGYKLEMGSTFGCIVRSDTAHGGKLGYIDTKGETRIPFEFPVLRWVGESRFFVGKPDSAGVLHYYLYDTMGNIVTSLPDYVQNFDSCFMEGLLLIGDDKGRAFVDRNGKVVIAPNKYQYRYPFYHGLTDVQFRHKGKLASGYVDKQNHLVIGPIEDSQAGPFSDGLGIVTRTLANGSYKIGAVNRSGKLIFPIEFNTWDAMGKRFILAERNGKFQVFLRETGQLYSTFPIGTTSVNAYEFDENNLVPINVGGTPESSGTSNNRATGGKWGYCSQHGNIVIKPIFSSVSVFCGDSATATIVDKYGDTKYGTIDRKGNWLLPPTYESIQNVGTDRLIAYSEPNNGAVRAFQDPRSRSLGLFIKLLKFYNLIGMSESELDATFGKGTIFNTAQQDVPPPVRKQISYCLSPHARCGNASISVNVGIDENNKVWGWRFYEMDHQWNWFTENKLILSYDFNDYNRWKIIPKPTTPPTPLQDLKIDAGRRSVPETSNIRTTAPESNAVAVVRPARDKLPRHSQKTNQPAEISQTGKTADADAEFNFGRIEPLVASVGGNLGRIDSSGQLRMPYEFPVLRYIGERRFFAGKPDQTGTMRYYLYDEYGQMVARLPDFAKDFNSGYTEGLLLIGDDKGRAFVDRNGKIVIAPNKYQYDTPFYQGLAAVQFDYNGKLASGYVDKSNNLICGPFEDSHADPFYRGLGVITRTAVDGSRKMGAVNKNGKLIFPIEFDTFDCLGKRLIGGNRNGRFQLFLRESGEVYANCPPGTTAFSAYDFDNNDLVPFNIGGTVVSPGQNSNTASGGKWGYCDEHGNVVIEPIFKSAGLFSGNTATAFVIDKDGTTRSGTVDRMGLWQSSPVDDSEPPSNE